WRAVVFRAGDGTGISWLAVGFHTAAVDLEPGPRGAPLCSGRALTSEPIHVRRAVFRLTSQLRSGWGAGGAEPPARGGSEAASEAGAFWLVRVQRRPLRRRTQSPTRPRTSRPALTIRKMSSMWPWWLPTSIVSRNTAVTAAPMRAALG